MLTARAERRELKSMEVEHKLSIMLLVKFGGQLFRWGFFRAEGGVRLFFLVC